ncbi:MAG: chromate transporter [Planctomycetes bacterium]|nr:chromate transporter [Planctomycetota bacterium]
MLAPCTLREFVLYFARLGALGFGGPIALSGSMQRDLVEQRRWISKTDYLQGLALAQLAPGPLAAQLAIYLGWVRAGVFGATLVGFAFILPSFVMVLGLSALYVRYGGLDWMQGVFYGIGAAVIALIARSAYKLVRLTLKADRLLWSVFVVIAVLTAWTETEFVVSFLAAGALVWLVRMRSNRSAATLLPGWVLASFERGSAEPATWIFAGLHGPADSATLMRIAWYFTEAGVFVFGSGLAIVPFLHGGVVSEFHWLDERQFLDAVAVAMITPGPVVITVAFIGYLVAGPAGAALAALAVFLPCYLFVVVPAPYFRRHGGNPHLRAIVDGVTAAATGAIAGAAFVLGRRALVDGPAVAICIAVFALLLLVKRLPEPLVILAAGIVGIGITSLGRG